MIFLQPLGHLEEDQELDDLMYCLPSSNSAATRYEEEHYYPDYGSHTTAYVAYIFMLKII